MPETKDWIFASSRMHGKQPLWPEAVLKNHIRPAAKRAGIVKHVTWHAFRHSFSTLLIANKNDLKTVQQLMRHTNPRITLELYTGAVDEITRRAQSQIVRQMLPGPAALGEPVGNV
jgi:site-specific recombinase XerD